MYETVRMIDEIISKQQKDIGSQPTDPNHLRLTNEVVNAWAPIIGSGTVFDVGCGQGLAKEAWERNGFRWIGLNIGKDFLEARKVGEVRHVDMHLLGYLPTADVIYARHVLEHTPLPIMALHSWQKHAKWCIVVVPAMENCSFNAQGHISIFPRLTWERYIRFAGWEIVQAREVEYNNPLPWPQGGAEWRWLLK